LAAKIAKGVDTVLDDKAVVARLEELGTYVKRMSPTELSVFIRVQRAKWSPVVQKFGVP
jgi:tripartite-type tricarboxylate transporter receptor subunit TctC